MEKNKINRFDLSAAFKALDEIETPIAEKGIRANRVDLVEHLHAKRPTDLLIEDYYDVSNTEELDAAKDERDAEVAKEKLARIEQIVDLDATSPEDLQPSYVGKVIVQCPQCMTLFYKDFADIQPSEDNSEMVNVAETCQHCGNDSGYLVIGKVDAIDETDVPEDLTTEETSDEVATTEEPAATEEEATATEPTDETTTEDVTDVETEEEVTEESLKRKSDLSSADVSAIMNNTDKLKIDRQQELVEGLDDIDSALEDHNEYIDYLKETIKKEEQELARTSNEEVKAAIQKRIDAATEELKAALPDAVRAVAEGEAVEETVEEDTAEEATESLKKNSKLTSADVSKLVSDPTELKINKQQALVEAAGEGDLDTILDSKEFKEPVSDAEVREYLSEGEELAEGPFGRFGDWLKKKAAKGIDKIKGAVSGAKTGIQKGDSETDKLDNVFGTNGGYTVYYIKADAPTKKFTSVLDKYKKAIADKKDATAASKAILAALGINELEAGEDKNPNVRVKVNTNSYKDAFGKGKQAGASQNKFVVITSKNPVSPLNGPLVLAIFDQSGPFVDLAHTIGDAYVDVRRAKEVQDAKDAELAKEIGLPDGWEDTTPAGDVSFVIDTGTFGKLKATDTWGLADNKLGTVLNKAAELKATVNVLGNTKDKPDDFTVLVAKISKGKRESDDAKIKEFLKGVVDYTMEALDTCNEDECELVDIDEVSLNENISKYLTAVYENVTSFTTTGCKLAENNNTFIVEGLISYKSGNTKPTKFTFTSATINEAACVLHGSNTLIAEDAKFTMNCKKTNSTVITENFGYDYTIGTNKIVGKTNN